MFYSIISIGFFSFLLILLLLFYSVLHEEHRPTAKAVMPELDERRTTSCVCLHYRARRPLQHCYSLPGMRWSFCYSLQQRQSLNAGVNASQSVQEVTDPIIPEKASEAELNPFFCCFKFTSWHGYFRGRCGRWCCF